MGFACTTSTRTPNVDDVIPLMAAGKLLPYLDIPFQHASPKVLKAMKRPAFEDKTLARIKQWREICPELTIRSTFIVGFPGETEEDFQYLLDWLTEAQLDRVGCFQYSPSKALRPTSWAWSRCRTRSSRTAGERFMAHQQAISAARLQLKVGKGNRSADRRSRRTGRGRPLLGRRSGNRRQRVRRQRRAEAGRQGRVRITDADEYDLWAELV